MSQKKIDVVIPHEAWLKLSEGKNARIQYAFKSKEWDMVQKSLNSPYDWFNVVSDKSNRKVKVIAYSFDIFEYDSNYEGQSYMKADVSFRAIKPNEL